jgi:hypothetical protein
MSGIRSGPCPEDSQIYVLVTSLSHELGLEKRVEGIPFEDYALV